MIAVPLPDLPERDLTLESDDPARGQAGNASVPPLAGRITLGGPFAVPVTDDYVADDPDLRAFVEREAAHCVYHLVHLSVSFASEPARPHLQTTAIELRLSSTATSPEPVAWSMTPLQITDSEQVERHFRLGPKLTLHDVVDLELGEVGQSVTSKRTEVFLQAHKEMQSDPGWEFRRTATMNLYGSFRLVMVVRAPRDGATSLSGTVRAATKGNLLRWYRRELPDPLPLDAVL